MLLRSFSIAVGPVLGGGLAQGLGFRSIFVFLLLATVILFVIMVVFLPETQRDIAGNGSLRLHGIYRPLLHQLKEPNHPHESAVPRVPRKITSRAILAPLRLMLEKDILTASC